MLLSAPKGLLKNSIIYRQPKAIYKFGFITEVGKTNFFKNETRLKPELAKIRDQDREVSKIEYRDWDWHPEGKKSRPWQDWDQSCETETKTSLVRPWLVLQDRDNSFKTKSLTILCYRIM